MLTHFPETLRARWFEESTHAELFGMDPGLHNGVGPGAEIVTAATSPSCSIEITCNQGDFLR